jgi:hypothetical protein
MTTYAPDAVFSSLKKVVGKYEFRFHIQENSDLKYSLCTKKPMEIDGKMHDEVPFISIEHMKDYMAFVFTPFKLFPDLADNIPHVLRKTLKGRTSLHIVDNDQETLEALSTLTAMGVEMYRRMGVLD